MSDDLGLEIHPDVLAKLGEIGRAFEGSTIDRKDVLQYLDVIKDAVDVHVDRERIRHGLWKEYDPDAQMRQIDIKAQRCQRIFEVCIKEGRPLTAPEQDAIGSECDDIINYATFAKRGL